MDWHNTNYSYIVEVNVVNQTNVDDVLGFLRGVVLEGLVVSENYYSDSRVQAKVTTIVAEDAEDGYIPYARLRIIASIPERGWSEELVTGYVSSISETFEGGHIKREYTIEGTMWGLLRHKINAPVSIGSGASMVNVWSDLMEKQTKMQFSTTNARDFTFSDTIVYEAGTDLSTLLFEISSGYSRMEVDGHGVVVLDKYVVPKNLNPTKILDFTNPRGLTIFPLSKTNNQSEEPGRAIVTMMLSEVDASGKSVQKVLVGSYDASPSDPSSMSNRGWLSARADSYSGKSEKPTVDELNTIAKQNWEESQGGNQEWSATTVFADYHAGDAATLITPADYNKGGSAGVKVLITGVRTNLEDFTQELTMKEV